MFFALALACQCETAIVTPRADSAAWLFMAQRQQSGEMPGRDLWDNKLPLIYLVGRAAVATGHPQIFLWLLEAALTAAGAAAIARMVDHGRAHDSQSSYPATFAGALLCISSGATSYHAGGYMTECYAMPLSALGALFTLNAARSPTSQRRAVYAVLSGLMWALAVSFRLPLGLAAVGVAAVMLPQIALTGQRVSFLVCHVFGIIAALMVVFVHPWMAGYLRECIDAAILWPLGIGHERIPGPLAPGAISRLGDWAQDVAKIGWLHAAAICGIIMARREQASWITRLVGVWYVAALASAAWGWASYAHYQYVALAPMCLAIGLLLKGPTFLLRRRLSGALVVLTGGVVSFQAGLELYGEVVSLSDTDRMAAVRFVETKTRPTEPVLLWAWGRNADILYKLNRPTGVRHFMAHAYLDMDAGLFNEFVTEFIDAPPAWILEDTRRKKPSLSRPADPLVESRVPSLKTLREFVATGYTRVAVYGPWSIHRLGPANASMPATQSTRP